MTLDPSVEVPELDKPIEVKSSVKSDVTYQTLRVFLLGALAFGAGQFVHSELVMATVIPVAALVAGFLATWLIGIHKLLDTHSKLKAMASWLPDRLARLK
jgi:hypothetical protein